MDRYIDQAEARRYNDFSLSTLPALSEMSPEIPNILSMLSDFSSRLQEVQNKAGDTRSTSRTLTSSRRQQSDHVATRLGRLLDRLQEHLEDGASFDLLRLFPSGTRRDIGQSVADRQAALGRAVAGLEQYQAEIPDSQVWLDELKPLNSTFSTLIIDEANAQRTKLGQSDQVNVTYRSWKQNYGAAKLMVRGILRRAGRENEWRDYFLDTRLAGTSAGGDDVVVESTPAETSTFPQ